MGNEVNEKFTKIIADMVMTHIRVIYNNQSNAQYLRLTEYDLLIHVYVAISNTMDILTFQFAMEHIKNAYNMFYQMACSIPLSFTFISTHV